MSKLINGSYNFNYASIIGGTGMTSDNVMDIGTGGNNLTADIAYIESHLSGSSLTGDITIGTTNANTININSGSTTYNNNEIITLKDNSTSSYILGSAGNTNMLVLDTTDATPNVNLSSSTNLIINNTNDPASYTDITSSLVVKGGIACAKRIVGGNITANGNLYASGNITSIGSCSVGSLVSSGAVSGTTITGTGNLTVGANGITCGNITNSGVILASNTTESTTTSTGAIICSGGVAIAKNLNVGGVITALGLNTGSNTIYGGAFNTANNMTCGSITNSGNYGGSGFINIGTNSMTCGAITSSGGISGTTITASTGLVLPTTGGTAATLNYYESNFNFPMMFQGAGGGGTSTTVNLTISRIGNIVNIIMPIVNINSNGSYITTNSAYYLPTRFRPSAVYIDYCMHSMNIATYLETGMINVCATGCINICKSSSSVSFGVGTGSGTANVFHMVYSV